MKVKKRLNLFQAFLEEPKGIYRSLKLYPGLSKLIYKNRKLNNLYKNEVLFILGNSPYLKDFDLNALKDKNILAMNRFYLNGLSKKIYEGNGLKFYLTPPLHGPYKIDFWENYLKNILDCTNDKTKIFIGISDKKESFHNFDCLSKGFNNIENIFYFLPVGPRFIEYSFLKKLFFNPYLPIISSGTASVYALLLACFMGFKEIYLLGIDHSNVFDRKKGNNENFYNDNSKNIEKKELNYLQWYYESNTFFQYMSIANFFPNSKIYNCSKTSYLDYFPFKDFNSIKLDNI